MLTCGMRTAAARAVGRRALHSSSAVYSSGQAKPSFDYKFLASPPTVGVSCSPLSSSVSSADDPPDRPGSLQVSCPAGPSAPSNKHSGGQPRSGVDLGPGSLISAGLASQLSSLGWQVDHASQPDFSAVPFFPNTEGRTARPDPDEGKMKRPRLVSAVNKLMSQAVGERAAKGWLPLTLGGDHSLVSLPVPRRWR